jgi:hypothetical protein
MAEIRFALAGGEMTFGRGDERGDGVRLGLRLRRCGSGTKQLTCSGGTGAPARLE